MKNRFILTTLLLAVTLVFVYMTWMFFLPLMLSLTLVVMVNPLYKKWEYRLGYRRGLAATLMTLLVVLVMILPVLFFVQVLLQQALEVFSFVRGYLKDPGIGTLIGEISSWPLFSRIDLNTIDWQSLISRSLSQMTSLTSKVVNSTSAGIIKTIADLFVIIFSLFFFLKDQESMMRGLKRVLPIDDTVIDHLAQKFKGTSRSAVQATLYIGLIQGAIGAVTFIIVGINSWLLWGAVMTVLSIIPLIGSYIVMFPAALILMAGGGIWQGIFILVMATVASYGVDNLLRPVFLSKDTRMHELLVFISSLGGMGLFGLAGFIAGPVIAATLLALLHIYKEGVVPDGKKRLHTRIRGLKK